MSSYFYGCKEIGRRIKKEREIAGYTQKELAEKVGLSASSIAQYESGDRNLKRSTVQPIADALNVPLSRLMPTREDLIAESVSNASNAFVSIQNAIEPLSGVQQAIKNAVSPMQKALSSAFGVSHEDIQSFAKAMADDARERRNLSEEEYAQEYSRWLAFYEENGIPVVNDKLPLPIDAVAFSAFLKNLEPEGQAKALQCISMLGEIQDKYILTTYQKPKAEE